MQSRVSLGHHSRSDTQDSSNLHFIQAVMNIFCGSQIPHRGFQRLVSHPMLYGARIKTGSEHARRVCGPECFEIEPFGIQFRSLSDVFAFVQEVKLTIATRRRKDETPSFMRMLLQTVNQLFGHGDFSVFPAFWIKSEIGLRRNLDRIQGQVDVIPGEMDNFLFPKACQEKCEKQRVFLARARLEKPVELFIIVFLRKRRDLLRQINLPREPTAAILFSRIAPR